ncbi:MAG: hypothetical protein MHMPM18_001168 [Marteilia pararefringens]
MDLSQIPISFLIHSYIEEFDPKALKNFLRSLYRKNLYSLQDVKSFDCNNVENNNINKDLNLQILTKALRRFELQHSEIALQFGSKICAKLCEVSPCNCSKDKFTIRIGRIYEILSDCNDNRSKFLSLIIQRIAIDQKDVKILDLWGTLGIHLASSDQDEESLKSIKYKFVKKSSEIPTLLKKILLEYKSSKTNDQQSLIVIDGLEIYMIHSNKKFIIKKYLDMLKNCGNLTIMFTNFLDRTHQNYSDEILNLGKSDVLRSTKTKKIFITNCKHQECINTAFNLSVTNLD